MQRYWWPGYETQLLGELRKQQNSTWFCDTLLQAEGISVPAHGCVLAALSPYLSQRLSASPSPPSGERRQLRLQAVKAETLLKLVGLLYSGEMAVKRGGEQNDVLAAARRFGIADLAEGPKDARTKDGELREKSRSLWSRRENGFHAEVDGRRRQESLQVQTETAGRKDETFKRRSRVSRSTQTVNVGGKWGRTKPPIPEAASSQSEEEFSVSLQPPNIPLDKQRSVTAFPTVPTDGDSAFTSVTNPTSTLSSDDSNSPRAEEENARREAPDSGGRVEATAEERTRPEDGGTNGGNAEEDGRVDGREMSADERGKWTETRPTHACAGMKNMNSMKKMQQDTDTKTSVRMKLRRTTEGTEWEVVNAQDADETVSAINCLTEFFYDITGQFDPDEVRPPPFTVHMSPVQNPENPRPAPVRSPERTEYPNTTFDPPPPPPLSNGCYPPDRSGELEPAALGQPQGCAEETDEQMERLLEDIMIGLNILPGLETGREESQPSRDAAPTVCRVSENEAGRSRVNGVVGAAGCLFFQDLEAPSGTSSTQTGTSCCFAAQNPAGHPDVVIQQQLLPPRYDPAVRPSVRSDGPSCRAPPPPSSSSQHPEAAAPRSVVASDFFPGGQKLYFPAFQQTSSRDDRYVLQFLPLTETQPEHAVPSQCADDMRLPPCLSPLGSRTSERPPLLGNSTNPRSDFQQPPSLFRRSLLAENPGTLQFPLSAITENRSASSPRDANHRWRSKRRQEPNQTESFAANGAEKRRTKSDTKKMKNSLKAEAPKRRKRRTKASSQTRDGSILGREDSKVGDGIKNFCPASLSSSNVPLKEREITSGSSVSESVAEKTGDLGTQRSRIGTRGLLKTSRDPASISHSSVFIPVVCRAKIASEESVSLPKRKRGRPPKRKHEENRDDVPAVAGKKSHDAESDRRTKRRSRRGEEKTPPKDAVKTERGDDDDDGASKRPRTASPEEFQKLVKRRHSNSRKPKESREADEAARDGGRRPKGSGEEPETDVDVEETGNGEGVDKHLRRLVETSAAEDGKSRGDETSSSSSWEDDRVEEERPMKTLDEGTLCAAAGSAAAAAAASNRVSLPRDPERPEPLRSATSGCDKEEEEEEEEEEKEDEEEVDVMFYSLGNVPQTGKREDGLRHTDATADEDEEEVDVTGDEAE